MTLPALQDDSYNSSNKIRCRKRPALTRRTESFTSLELWQGVDDGPPLLLQPMKKYIRRSGGGGKRKEKEEREKREKCRPKLQEVVIPLTGLPALFEHRSCSYCLTWIVDVVHDVCAHPHSYIHVLPSPFISYVHDISPLYLAPAPRVAKKK